MMDKKLGIVVENYLIPCFLKEYFRACFVDNAI